MSSPLTCPGGLMPSQPATPSRTGRPASRIGVGIDASRYGHHAAFLDGGLQPAAAELSYPESAHGDQGVHSSSNPAALCG